MPRFVVHEHHASHLHWDFRLEVAGVLKSWAVPKGPSMNPADKRLAIQVADHPLAYGSFAGTIPEGEYGAGDGLIWDSGNYAPVTDREAGLRAGLLKFTLAGGRRHGGFTLVRFKRGATGKEWWLRKHRPSLCPNSTSCAVWPCR
jgi:bifunctional non-homologous end joining protein LigD